MHTVNKPVLVVPDYGWQLSRSQPESGVHFFLRRLVAKLLGLTGSRVGKLSLGRDSGDEKGNKAKTIRREAAQECSPQPALSLPKGREPWVSDTACQPPTL